MSQLAADRNRQPRIAILGIGNTFRSDDAAGPLVARSLAKSHLIRDLDTVLVMDAGYAPENSTAELRRFAPDVVLLVDAADLGEAPGTIRWIGLDEIGGMSASTHTLPLELLAKYLVLELGCEVSLLGIQPLTNETGKGVSREVTQAVDQIMDGLSSSLFRSE